MKGTIKIINYDELNVRMNMVDDIDKIIVKIINLRKKYKLRSLDRNDYGVDEFMTDLSLAQENLEEAKRDALRMLKDEEDMYPSGLGDKKKIKKLFHVRQ